MKIDNILYLGAALLLAGCSADTAFDESEQTPINLGYTVLQATETRAATNLNEDFLSQGDKILAKISKASENDYSDFTYMTVNDAGKMVPVSTTIPTYPDDGSNVKIRAFYPSTAGASFTVKSNQTADEDYRASDLMFASIANQARTSETVNLAFEHQMSKIVINASGAEGSGITITGVTLKNILPTITFTPDAADIADVVSAASGDPVDITMTNEGAALIPAQDINGTFLVISTSAGDATYSLSKSFEAGHSYTLNIEVGTACIGTTNAITGWNGDGIATVGIAVDQIKVFNVNGVFFNMVFVEAGSFENCGGVEGCNVTLTQNYYIGQTEVTQALWYAVMGSNPSGFTGNLQRPVETVSWNDICDPNGFLDKLNAATGMTFSLPTEAQWEWAARGGKYSQNYEYSGSNTIGDVAWYNSTSLTNTNDCPTHPVGTKMPNELGLYDMSGNVWEWCSDYFSTLSAGTYVDPTGPSTGTNRVTCGGCSYDTNTKYLTVYSRYSREPETRLVHRGLRLVLQ